MSEPQFAELFEEFAKQRQLAEGTDLLAQVRDINENYVIVNAGLKSEAHIPLEEFYDGNKLEVAIGDDVEVEIELLENGRGEAVLSRRNTRRKQAWKRVEEAFKNEGALEGTISSRVRGGYAVSVDGLRAFLPGSLVDILPHSDPYAIVGTRMEVRPIKVNAARNSLVVSRRAVIESNMSEVNDDFMVKSIAVDSRFRGTVRAVVEYGAFVEIANGVYGLLHITDIAWKHTSSINEVLAVGNEVDVVVLSVDTVKNRIALGMKQLLPNPWEFFDRAHPVGSRMFGKVTRVLEYGIFVEVEDGVQGLVHSSEMSWTRKNPNPLKLYSSGDEVEVTVLDIDVKRRRISLGIKQCVPNPWQEFAAAYRKGNRVTGIVRSISEFGIFMELQGGIDGLVRMSELSFEEAGRDVAQAYKQGQKVEVVILSIDAENERISLGVKQLSSMGFESFVDNHLRGTAVRGTISSIAEKGAHVTLEGDVRGFVPIGEISEQRVNNIADFLKEGEEHEFVLLTNDMRNMRAIVSLKERDRQDREKAMQERKQQAMPSNTLGALLQAKIRESEAPDSATESAPSVAKKSAPKKSATKKSAAKESVSAESIPAESATKESSSAESASEESATKESSSAESVSAESVTKESASVESVSAESATKESASAESVSEESTTKESVSAESASAESATKESASAESVSEESTTKESASEESASAESVSEESTTKKSAPKKSAAKKSAAKESASEESVAKESTSAESVSAESATKESASAEFALEESATKESASAESAAKESVGRE